VVRISARFFDTNDVVFYNKCNYRMTPAAEAAVKYPSQSRSISSLRRKSRRQHFCPLADLFSILITRRIPELIRFTLFEASRRDYFLQAQSAEIKQPFQRTTNETL